MDEEFLELHDYWCCPLGVQAPRSLIHGAGRWHRSFHCWVVRQKPAGEAEMVLQLRSPAKETWPGLWDISVGGHYRPGEGPEGGIREIQEELGLRVMAHELVYLGRRREIQFCPNGLIDREHQDEYLLLCDLPLEEYRPDPEEVSGLASLPARSLLAMRLGSLEAYRAQGVAVDNQGRVTTRRFLLRRKDLVPRSKRYFRWMTRAARVLAASRDPRQPL